MDAGLKRARMITLTIALGLLVGIVISALAFYRQPNISVQPNGEEASVMVVSEKGGHHMTPEEAFDATTYGSILQFSDTHIIALVTGVQLNGQIIQYRIYPGEIGYHEYSLSDVRTKNISSVTTPKSGTGYETALRFWAEQKLVTPY